MRSIFKSLFRVAVHLIYGRKSILKTLPYISKSFIPKQLLPPHSADNQTGYEKLARA